MIWIYVSLGLCLLFIILPAIIGSFMKKDHTCKTSGWLNASVTDVWKILDDQLNFPAWRKDLKAVLPLPDHNGSKSWKEIGRNGQSMELAKTSSVTESETTWTIINNRSFGGNWIFSLTPENNGTRLDITENGFVNNVVLRFMFRTFFKSSSSIDKFLGMLKGHLNR